MIARLLFAVASAQSVSPPIETPIPEVTIATNIPAVEWSCALDAAKGKAGHVSGIFGPIARSPSYNVPVKIDADQPGLFQGRLDYVQERYGTYTLMIWPTGGSQLGTLAAFHFRDLSGIGDVEFSQGVNLTNVVAAGHCSVKKLNASERGA